MIYLSQDTASSSLAKAIFCMYRPVIFLIFFVCIHAADLPANAQNGAWDQTKKSGKKAKDKMDKGQNKVKKLKNHITQWGLENDYTHHLALGGRLNTNGWGAGVYYQKKVKPGLSQVFSLNFSEIKHEKQIKQQRGNTFPELGKPTPFVFGKVNNLYTLQLGHGREQLVLPGVIEDNLSVSLRFTGGFSLAMLKPYYLRLAYVDFANGGATSLKEEKYNNSNAETFLRADHIVGASKWKKGLDEMQYIPGAFLDAAIAIEPVKSKVLVQTITIGANIAYYAKALPVMAERKAYRGQACFYIGLSLGKKW